MLTENHARRIAEIVLEAVQQGVDEPLVLLDPPRTFREGWIYVYDSQRYVETGDIGSAVGGNAPIAVFASGRVELLSTSESLEKHVARLNAG